MEHLKVVSHLQEKWRRLFSHPHGDEPTGVSTLLFDILKDMTEKKHLWIHFDCDETQSKWQMSSVRLKLTNSMCLLYCQVLYVQRNAILYKLSPTDRYFKVIQGAEEWGWGRPFHIAWLIVESFYLIWFTSCSCWSYLGII